MKAYHGQDVSVRDIMLDLLRCAADPYGRDHSESLVAWRLVGACEHWDAILLRYIHGAMCPSTKEWLHL